MPPVVIVAHLIIPLAQLCPDEGRLWLQQGLFLCRSQVWPIFPIEDSGFMYAHMVKDATLLTTSHICLSLPPSHTHSIVSKWSFCFKAEHLVL